PAVNPRYQRFTIRAGQPPIIDELAVFGVGVPGRHAALLNHLADGPRPVHRVLVTDQRHRPDLSGTVAFLAVLLQDRGDIFCKRDRAVLPRLDRSGDQAALDLGDGDPDRLAGKHIVEGVGQLVCRRLVAAVTVAELIVHASAVHDLAPRPAKPPRAALGPATLPPHRAPSPYA